jgi:hypothetical protein
VNVAIAVLVLSLVYELSVLVIFHAGLHWSAAYGRGLTAEPLVVVPLWLVAWAIADSTTLLNSTALVILVGLATAAVVALCGWVLLRLPDPQRT